MRADELIQMIRRRPFRPLRLHISSGQHVDITHPEAAVVSRSMVAVAPGNPDTVADYIVHYSLVHVAKVETLDPALH